MNWYLIGAFLTAGLVLMARSAWIQGELDKFLKALALVLLLLASLSGFVAGWIWLNS
ncbi:hypothetical protein [Indioceanicola profundi]|uniref:hypothetical protein n=1 Tax=Indioceanicola profundi TaxID=2220096 RepID=UPI0013C43735|nr:hypothetical protein [Indioceanicola profundi]